MNSSTPEALTAEQCKLLQAPEVVAQYNLVLKTMDNIAAILPSLAERDGFKTACEDLEKLAVRITQERYRIGFIGVSRAGKSTTAGNVLGADGESENPCPPSDRSEAATAIATRILPFAEKQNGCLEGEEHKVELIYLTRPQFRERVQQFFDVLKLDFDRDSTPEKWLAQCEAHEIESPHESPSDRIAVIRLIKAAIKYPECIKEKADPEPGSFEFKKRKEYVTHPDDPRQVSKYALLREMRVSYKTNRVAETLEIIDLPGLGTERRTDDKLTEAFLKELAGAFLFTEQQLFTGGPAADLTASFRREYGNTIHGRLWQVVTKCDNFKPSDLDDPRESKLTTIKNKMTSAGFSLDKLVLVSNYVYESLESQAKNGEARNPASAWKAKSVYVRPFSDSGVLIYPNAIENIPEFKDAYTSLAEGGGIERISRLMTERVEAAVRKETQEDAKKVLNCTVETLCAELQAAREMGGMSSEQIESAARAANDLTAIARNLNRSDSAVRDLYITLRDSLRETLERLHDAHDSPTLETHKNLARDLGRSGVTHAEKLKQAVITEVDDKTVHCSANIVPMVKNALVRWEASKADIFSGRSDPEGRRQGNISTAFTMPDALAKKFWTTTGQCPTAEVYFAMLNEKIDCVTQCYASQLSAAIATAVGNLASDYRNVGSAEGSVDPEQVTLLEKLISDLRGR